MLDLAEGSQVSAGKILEIIRAMQAGVLPAVVVVDHQAGKIRIHHHGEAPESSLKDKIFTRAVSGPYGVVWLEERGGP